MLVLQSALSLYTILSMHTDHEIGIYHSIDKARAGTRVWHLSILLCLVHQLYMSKRLMIVRQREATCLILIGKSIYLQLSDTILDVIATFPMRAF
jgi:hypothetical protein